MPLKFCKIRWVENVPVTERMIKILPDLMIYVHVVETGKFLKPATKSDLTVKEGCTDPLMLWPFVIFKRGGTFLESISDRQTYDSLSGC